MWRAVGVKVARGRLQFSVFSRLFDDLLATRMMRRQVQSKIVEGEGLIVLM